MRAFLRKCSKHGGLGKIHWAAKSQGAQPGRPVRMPGLFSKDQPRKAVAAGLREAGLRSWLAGKGRGLKRRQIAAFRRPIPMWSPAV